MTNVPLVRDGDLVASARGLVLCRHVQDAVGVDGEGDFNLWDTSWRWWDPVNVKLAQEIVVLRHCALALRHMDRNAWLVVSVGGGRVPLLRGDRRVAPSELGHDSACSLQAHGQRESQPTAPNPVPEKTPPR